nr:flagellar basal body P-ring formation chaperone FlgA [Desulfobacterales bacterium]
PPSNEAQVNITAVRIKNDILLPKGKISHEVHVQHQSAPSRLLPVTLVFAVDGRFERKVAALVGLEVIQNVVVSRKPIPRLKIITPDDVLLRPMNVVGRRDDVIRAVEDVIGKRARRAIGMNRELHAGMVEWPPVVKKGDRVMIVAESGNLRITTMGEVKSTGKVGEQVRVVNLDSKKTVMAQVLDGRTVRVAF